MGTDVYMRWTGQTEEEAKAQICGFDITRGHVGYLRESIWGVSAIAVLLPESYGQDVEVVADAAPERAGTLGISEMERRLPDALDTVRQRYHGTPWGGDVEESFHAFVALARKHVDAGRRVWIHNSY